MAEQMIPKETVTLEEFIVSHSYEMLALFTILEMKGILTREEIITVIKELRDLK